MKFRKMKKKDITPIYVIEQKLCPYPWTEKTFEDCIDIGYGCFVIEDSKKVLGFGVASIFFDEAHILNLGIAKEKQGKGLGYKMMKYLLDYIEESGLVERVFLEVSVNNKTAMKLYQTFGFKKIGFRKDYYRIKKGREDAFVLCLEL